MSNPSLEELVSAITEENRHNEIDTWSKMGIEHW